MHRSTFLPLQHAATLIFSVDRGLHISFSISWHAIGKAGEDAHEGIALFVPEDEQSDDVSDPVGSVQTEPNVAVNFDPNSQRHTLHRLSCQYVPKHGGDRRWHIYQSRAIAEEKVPSGLHDCGVCRL